MIIIYFSSYQNNSNLSIDLGAALSCDWAEWLVKKIRVDDMVSNLLNGWKQMAKPTTSESTEIELSTHRKKRKHVSFSPSSTFEQIWYFEDSTTGF